MKFQGDKSSISISIEVGINFCRVTLTHDINIDNSNAKIREEYIIESSSYYAFIIGVNLIGYFRKNEIIYGKILPNSISIFAENVVSRNRYAVEDMTTRAAPEHHLAVVVLVGIINRAPLVGRVSRCARVGRCRCRRRRRLFGNLDCVVLC